ncbi:hypothetical protein O6H91_17G082000 [Diphasiastrum complanatum]|uniref:Uncharacterized protein n=1 Tax=Diphasiastrum complanatum TaxID=34168 RepID=A0ACC2B8G8_DIPCM|nr:hypothetical protein O6H91_17G082000 [Diphasiastrum complanatum]
MLSSVRFLSRDDFPESEETSTGSEQEQVAAHKKHKHKAHKKASKSSRRKHSFDSFSFENEGVEINESSISKGEEKSSEKRKKHKSHRASRNKGITGGEMELCSDLSREQIGDEINLTRKEAGLDWMLNAPPRAIVTPVAHDSPPRLEVSEPKANPKELNPYFKNEGAGFPSEREDEKKTKAQGASLQRPPAIGDGGASWRLKALKRAQEQAAREGRKLDEVVEERWGSLGALTSSVATRRAAHANAHHHAIRDRKHQVEVSRSEGLSVNDDRAEKGCSETNESGGEGMVKDSIQKGKQDFSQMKAPRINESLSWRDKRSFGSRQMRPEDAAILKAAVSTYNKYDDDGSFLKAFSNEHLSACKLSKEKSQCVYAARTNWIQGAMPSDAVGMDPQKENCTIIECRSSSTADMSNLQDAKVVSQHPVDSQSDKNSIASGRPEVQSLSANQVAAKAMRLRLMGKAQEADELIFEDDTNNRGLEKIEKNSKPTDNSSIQKLEDRGSAAFDGTLLRAVAAKHKLEDQNISVDSQLAESIGRNRQYKGPGPMSIDDEYDNNLPLEASAAGSRRKAGNNAAARKNDRTIAQYKHIVTQHERCQFCFENPSRPKHLIVAIANFTYLMLPTKFSLVQGHCYIVPMQHEGSTRNADDNVWEEVRNFKKCLVKMFMQQNKDVVFIETVIGLVRQKRHCLVECIPISLDTAKQAPLYFKKAIEEAEDEWSQHNAKKLIDTRSKGLRACIPKNFPYFHVEFGMQGGYCHVIDDEAKFNRNLGHDVIKGILQEPEEELHSYAKQDSAEKQRQAVIEFSKMWKPYDWTKMLA